MCGPRVSSRASKGSTYRKIRRPYQSARTRNFLLRADIKKTIVQSKLPTTQVDRWHCAHAKRCRKCSYLCMQCCGIFVCVYMRRRGIVRVLSFFNIKPTKATGCVQFLTNRWWKACALTNRWWKACAEEENAANAS